jgi:hypothetical protein
MEPDVTTTELADAAADAAEARRDARVDTAPETPGPLFAREESDALRQRWMEIQTRFVDDPRASVKDADGLVADAMKRLSEVFSSERSRLEGQWSRGDDVGTEDLRQAMRRYRSFFDRLLSV